jgi:hypothetical protein
MRWRDCELIRDDSENISVIVHVTQNTAINGDTHQTISATNDTPDDRVTTATQLRAKISDYLIVKQRDQLLAVLMKYQPRLTKLPGKCTGF